mgnify:CR=1 FL=1
MWFKPRNLTICRALNAARVKAFGLQLYLNDAVPWAIRKHTIRRLPNDDSAFAAVGINLIEPDENGPNGLDPLEDFTNYEVLDDNNRLTITEHQVTITDLTGCEDVWVYDDKGAGHFGSSFEHLVDVRFTSSNKWSATVLWALSNIVAGVQHWIDNNSEAIAGYFSGISRLYFRNYESGSLDYASASFDTDYYLRIIRSSGTLVCELYTDPSRTAEYLHDTITIAIPSGRTYRYVFAVNTQNNDTGGVASAVVANLDLQEGGGAVYDGTCEASAGTSAATAANAMVGFATSGAAAVATGGVSGASVAKIAVAPMAGASATVKGIASAVAKVTSNASASGLSAAGFVYRVLATCMASAGSMMQGTGLADALLESTAGAEGSVQASVLADALLESTAGAEGSVQASVLADAVIEACATTGARIEAVAFVLGAVSLSISASATTRATLAEVIQIIAAKTRSTAINKILNAKTLDDLLALNIHRILNAKPGG